MTENPYEPATAGSSHSKTRATRWLVWSGVVCISLAALCLLATIVGMALTFESIAESSTVEPSDLARGLNASLIPSMAAVPLAVLGVILLIAGLVRRKPVSKQQPD